MSLLTPVALLAVPAPSCVAALPSAVTCSLETLPDGSPEPCVWSSGPRMPASSPRVPEAPLEAAISLPQTLPPPHVLRKCHSQDATGGGSPEGSEKGLFSLPLPSLPRQERRAGDGHLHDSNDTADFLKLPESPQRPEGKQVRHPLQGPPFAGAARPLVRRRGPPLAGPGGDGSPFHRAQARSSGLPVAPFPASNQ